MFCWGLKTKTYQFDGPDDPLHGFVKGDVQPTGDPLIEPTANFINQILLQQ